MDDKTRRALMTLLYIVLAAWFCYAAYTEAMGKWITFPVAETTELSQEATEPVEPVTQMEGDNADGRISE